MVSLWATILSVGLVVFTGDVSGAALPPDTTGPVGYGAQTTGGKGGPVVRVSTAAELKKQVQGNDPKTIVITQDITLDAKLKVGSNKSIVGNAKGITLSKRGISIRDVSNVIIRNLKISKTKDDDNIEISGSKNVWIDHNEFESDCCAGGPDKYDGQIDIVRGSDLVTVSWNYLHDHWKSSLVGNSDKNRAQDTGKLRVTYHHNYWKNIGTRGPAGRFGNQHIWNNVFEDFLFQAMHSRSDNQMLVEGNVFAGKCAEAVSSYGLVIPEDSPNTSPKGDYEIDGYVNLGAKNDFKNCKVNVTRPGNFAKAPYQYSLTPLAEVEQSVKASAGIGKITVP